MKRPWTSREKIVVWILLILLTTIGNFWMYLHSQRRFQIEHGIDLPLHASNVETYGNAWQFWRDCGIHSWSYFEIPATDYDAFEARVKITLELPVEDGATLRISHLPGYLSGVGNGFVVTKHLFIHSNKEGCHQELRKIENGEKVVVGLGTFLMNSCD
jgi:hypothetical protein